MEVRLEPVLASDPQRAARFALAADQLAPGVGTELGMLEVATQAIGLDRVLQAHDGPVTAIARWKTAVATAGHDRTLRLWDPVTGAKLAERELAVPIVHMASSDSLDGVLLTADERGAITQWDTSNPSTPAPRTLAAAGEQGPPRLVGFSPEGVLALAIWPDGTIRRWDVASGAAVTTLHLRDVQGNVAWQGRHHSPRIDAATMLTLTNDPELLVATHDGAVSQVNLRTLHGRRVVPPGQINGTVTTLAGSGDDNAVVATTATSVLTWNKGTSSRLVSENAAGASVAYSYNSYYVANARGVETINENVDDPTVSTPALPAATLAAVGPGGVAIGHADGTVSLLDPTTDDDGGGIALEPGEKRSLARFMPDGLLLTTEGYDANHVSGLAAVRPGTKDPKTGEPHRTVRTYRPAGSWWPHGDDDSDEWYVNDADATEDLVAAAGQDPTRTASILVWNARTGRPLKRLALTTGGINPNRASIVSEVRLLAKKHLLAAYSGVQEALVLWSTDTWQRVATIAVGPAGGFSVTPDESRVIVAGLSDEQSGISGGYRTSRLEFVDIDKQTVDHTIATKGTARAEVSPDGDAIATADDERLRILSPDGRRDLVRPIPLEATLATTIAWRPDSRVIAVGRTENGTAIVDATAGRVVTALPPPGGDVNTIPFTLSWSPSGGLLVATNGVSSSNNNSGYSASTPSFWRLDRPTLRARMCRLSTGNLTAAQWRRDVGSAVAFQQPCRYTSLRPSAPRAPRRPVVAFTQDDIVLVADDDGHAVRVGRFPEAWVTTDTLTIAPDGAVAWVAQGRLHVLRDGVLRSWACPCNRVVFDAATAAAVTVNGSALLTFTGRSPRATRIPVHGLPHNNATLLALHGTDGLVAGFDRVPDRNEPATLVPFRHGRAQERRTRPNSWPSSAPVESPDRQQVVFRTSPSNGACYPTDGVAIVDIATAHLTRPSLPADVKDPHAIRSLSWPADGALSALVSRAPCDPAGGAIRWAPAGQLLQLDGEQFVRVPKRDFDIAVRPGLTARLTGRVPAGKLRARLVLQADDGRTTPVANGVTTMVLRP